MTTAESEKEKRDIGEKDNGYPVDNNAIRDMTSLKESENVLVSKAVVGDNTSTCESIPSPGKLPGSEEPLAFLKEKLGTDQPSTTGDEEKPTEKVEIIKPPAPPKRKKRKPTVKLFRGTFVHSSEESPLLVLEKRVIGVEKGVIIFNVPDNEFEELVEQYKIKKHMETHCVNLDKNEFMLPGFVDAHCQPMSYLSPKASANVHSDQLINMIQDDRIAKQLFKSYTTYCLQMGTTTAAYDTGGIESVVRVLTNILENIPQRAFIGLEVGELTRSEGMQMLQMTKVKDCLNFIQVRKAGVILQQTKPVASTFQERVLNLRDEYQLLYKMFWNRVSEKESQAEDLQSFGLPLDKTIMLTHDLPTHEEEVKQPGVKWVLCASDAKSTESEPLCTSGCNYFSPFGLGTGAVGPGNLTILEAIQRVHMLTKASVEDLFYMATLGSAIALNMDHIVGNFKVGKRFDALMVVTQTEHSRVLNFPHHDKTKDLVERFLLYGDSHNIKRVYISGNRVW